MLLLGWPPHRLLKVIEDTLYPLCFLREPEPLFLEQVSFLLSRSGYPDVGVLNGGQLGAKVRKLLGLQPELGLNVFLLLIQLCR